MKKLLLIATALFLVTGVSFADGTKKKKKAKAKKTCCKKEESCSKKEKDNTVKL